MPLMRWGGSLDVGVEEMNHDHKQILDLMNQIRDASEAGTGGESMIELVEDLERATLEHFNDEEAYMESIAYDGLPSHRAAHEELAKKLSFFADETTENDGRISHGFLMFMMLWLKGHIRGIDMKYGEAAAAIDDAEADAAATGAVTPIRRAG